MFTLLVLISRYIFIFFMLAFLVQSFFYVAAERGHVSAGPMSAVRLQRLVLVLMHVTAFLILAWKPEASAFDINVIISGVLSLGFFALAWVFSSIVYRGSCPLMWNCVFFLMDVGIIMIQRISHASAVRQLMWFVVGFGLALAIPPALKIIPRFEKLEIAYLVIGFILLILPVAAGYIADERVEGISQYGATIWVSLFGVTFQPSELVKFLLVFYLASVFRKRQTLVSLVVPGGAAALFIAVLAVQRDLGGALIFFMVFMTMLYIATGSAPLCLCGFGAFAGVSVAAYHLFSHVRVRVAAWQDPFADIEGGGYQIAQGLFAIGSRGLRGSGLTLGAPTAIPIVESDFIFAAICEEFGGIFAAGLIAIIVVIFYRGIHIALRAERRYYSLLASGFAVILAFQSFLILGGVTKLIPLTGVTLPFVSYGGSSVVVSLLMIGILQWVHSYYRYDTDESETGEAGAPAAEEGAPDE